MLKEATKRREECGASHKREAEMLWEHMDATLIEPSACQNGAEALQPIQPGRRVRISKTGNFGIRRDNLEALGKTAG